MQMEEMALIGGMVILVGGFIFSLIAVVRCKNATQRTANELMAVLPKLMEQRPTREQQMSPWIRSEQTVKKAEFGKPEHERLTDALDKNRKLIRELDTYRQKLIDYDNCLEWETRAGIIRSLVELARDNSQDAGQSTGL